MKTVGNFSDFPFHCKNLHNLNVKINSMGSFPFSYRDIPPDSDIFLFHTVFYYIHVY